MQSIDVSSFLTTEERLSEVAGIFAAGILRLHARNALSGDKLGQKNLDNSAPEGLEVSSETVLTVHRG